MILAKSGRGVRFNEGAVAMTAAAGRQEDDHGARLIDFYDMKIAAGIGFRVLVSITRRGPDLNGNY
jgi:hypothetical protein